MWGGAVLGLLLLLWAALLAKMHTGDFKVLWKALLWFLVICVLACLIAFLIGPVLSGVVL